MITGQDIVVASEVKQSVKQHTTMSSRENEPDEPEDHWDRSSFP